MLPYNTIYSIHGSYGNIVQQHATFSGEKKRLDWLDWLDIEAMHFEAMLLMAKIITDNQKIQKIGKSRLQKWMIIPRQVYKQQDLKKSLETPN